MPRAVIAEDETLLRDDLVQQLKWRHQFQFAGFYAALEKGYYRDASERLDQVKQLVWAP